MDFSLYSFEVFLFSVAIVAGFIDTLAGGGGIITLPALMLSGASPLSVLGTNKLQGSVGTATATYMMFKSNRLKWHEVKYLMLFSFIGATIGAVFVHFVNVDVLNFLIPLVLILISIYFLFAPKSHEKSHLPVISGKKYRNYVVPSIGCYDGMFGPGTGSFFSSAAASLRGLGFIEATVYAKGLNFSSNIAALTVFIFTGEVIWLIGLAMMMGQVIGAWLGVHCLFKINPTYLRIIVVIMCMSMLLKFWLNQ